MALEFVALGDVYVNVRMIFSIFVLNGVIYISDKPRAYDEDVMKIPLEDITQGQREKFQAVTGIDISYVEKTSDFRCPKPKSR